MGAQISIGYLCDGPPLPDYVSDKFTMYNSCTDVRVVDVVLQTCKYMYIHHLGSRPSSSWSSGEFPVSQAWAVCFGLFKLPTHSSTQDRARPLHLWQESSSQTMVMGLFLLQKGRATRARNTCILRLHASFWVHPWQG